MEIDIGRHVDAPSGFACPAPSQICQPRISIIINPNPLNQRLCGLFSKEDV
jgi:hypothetical protein